MLSNKNYVLFSIQTCIYLILRYDFPQDDANINGNRNQRQDREFVWVKPTRTI